MSRAKGVLQQGADGCFTLSSPKEFQSFQWRSGMPTDLSPHLPAFAKGWPSPSACRTSRVHPNWSFSKILVATTSRRRMPSNMKVHLYDVHNQASPPIEVALAAISATPLVHRMRSVGLNEIRLENCLPPNTSDNVTDYWLLDFTNLRFKNGPGRANRTAPMTGFNLGPEDGFGEETAALYDPTEKVLLVQYNHHGPRASAICSYINYLWLGVMTDYELTIRLNLNASLKLQKQTILRKIQTKITPPKISSDMKNSGTSLESALSLSNSIGGNSIEITISAGRSKKSKLNFEKGHEFISAIKQLMNNGDVVKKLEIEGRPSQGAPIETIDLIEEKIETTIDNLTLGSDLRYTQSSRWEGLLRARNGWSTIL